MLHTSSHLFHTIGISVLCPIISVVDIPLSDVPVHLCMGYHDITNDLFTLNERIEYKLIHCRTYRSEEPKDSLEENDIFEFIFYLFHDIELVSQNSGGVRYGNE